MLGLDAQPLFLRVVERCPVHPGGAGSIGAEICSSSVLSAGSTRLFLSEKLFRLILAGAPYVVALAIEKLPTASTHCFQNANRF